MMSQACPSRVEAAKKTVYDLQMIPLFLSMDAVAVSCSRFMGTNTTESWQRPDTVQLFQMPLSPFSAQDGPSQNAAAAIRLQSSTWRIRLRVDCW